MGALKGSMTTTAYFARGELPTDFQGVYLQAMTKYRFRDIDVNGDSSESLGWVVAENPFDTDFDLNRVLFGSYLLMSLRVDKIRIPSNVLKLHLHQAVAEAAKELGQEELSRDQKEELKEMVEKQLRRRALPSITTYDVVWNMDRNMVWLFTGSKTLRDSFESLFTDTFGFALIPRTPYTQLSQTGTSPEDLDHLLQLEQTTFITPDMTHGVNQ
jgi:recombination associated protein RdgC